MEDSHLIKNIRDSLANFEQTCSDTIQRNRLDDENDLRQLEGTLDDARQNLHQELDMQLKSYSNAVKGKKPVYGTPADDFAYDAYRMVLNEANTDARRIHSWLGRIFDTLKGLIVSIVNKIRKNAIGLWDFIRREFRKLICMPF